MFNPTKEQKSAIDARGSVTVSAAAGSGKTAVLVERIISLLRDEKSPLSLDRLLIVTFTNAAAAEMRSRIEKRLREELAADPENIYLQKQRMLLPSANICTTDSFCIKLVRENFERFELPPDFRIVEENALSPLYDEALDAVLTESYDSRPNETAALLSALDLPFGDDGLRSAIISLYKFAQTMPFPDGWFARCRALYENYEQSYRELWREEKLKEPTAKFAAACEHLREAAKKAVNNPAFAQEYLEKIRKLLSDAEEILNADRSEAEAKLATLDLFLINNFKSDETAKVYREARKELKDAAGTFAEALGSEQSDLLYLSLAAPHMIYLFTLTERFSALLLEIQKKRGILSFHNTEQLALNLLCGEDLSPKDDDKAREITDQYDEILVDEYQDTNDLQDRLFYLLSDGGKKLFTVGDAKQSIFNFRGSNPENFIRRDCGRRITLSRNFRSRPEICAFINFFFTLTMSKEFGGVDYTGGELLVPAAEFPETQGEKVEINLVCCGEEDREIAEARHVAAYIKRELAVRKVKCEGGTRNARFSDFAVLLRSPGKHSEAYLTELNRAGIPARYEQEGFLQSIEVSTVLSLLQSVNNPTRDVPLLSLMCSPLFGFSAEDAAEIRLARSGGSLYGSVIAAAENGNEKASAFRTRLGEWRRASVSMRLDDFISRIYDETGLFDTVSALPDGDRRRLNLQTLLSLATEYAAGGNLRGFAKYIEKIGENIKTPSAAAGGDEVTIVSFHKSKGLQYPFCIIGGCFREFNNTDSRKSLVTDRRLGAAFKLALQDENVKIDTPARTAIAKSCERSMISEELRLIYVAMTRAEEGLLILLTDKDPVSELQKAAKCLNARELSLSAKKSFDWFLYVLLRLPACEELRNLAGADFAASDSAPDDLRVFLRQTPPECAEEAKKNIIAAPADCEEIKKRLSFEYPYAGASGVATKFSVSELTHNDASLDYKRRPAFLSASGLTAAQKGTATHKFMQFADFEAAASDINSELSRMREHGFLSPAEADAVSVPALSKFFSGRLFERISKARSIRREMRFLTEAPVEKLFPEADCPGERTVVQGVIDCVIDEGDRLLVLDFKTDHGVTAEKLRERYAPQLEIYASACEKMFSKPVTERLIYSFSLGTEIEV